MKLAKLALLSGVIMSNSAHMPLGAYDANDPADKAIFDAAVEAALEAERETHSAEVERLNGKNKDLLKKIAKLREGGDNADAGEITRLEGELDTAKAELNTAKSSLRIAERDLKAVTTERDTLKTDLDGERNYSNSQLTDNALNSALAEHKVAPHFMDAARALLGKDLKVEVNEDGSRKVTANGKDVGEFVKEWSASDAGKHYVLAPGNAGGGSNGANGGGSPTGKKLAEMSETERSDMATNRPDEWNALLAAEQPANAFPVIN